MSTRYPPATHRHDPPTSGEALEQHEASGARERHCVIVLRLVRERPGSTACELWAGAAPRCQAELKEMQEVRRRLCDLTARSLVEQGEARPCRVRGTRQVTWHVAEAVAPVLTPPKPTGVDPDAVQLDMFGGRP